ncbi:MAG TPA: CpsB/CapC family capsule biosynthesis tyrosine phosphatase [Desulfuromonadales bacterium]|nr:CpsB/CapC family capsule biosynthesis tyrosine phosphatase [Desulfuromonadales bacterium]
MIDFHCHLLPDIDDGPATRTESLEMARILAAHGFLQVCCTPHCIRDLYDNTPAGVRRAVAELQAVIDREAIRLRLLAGMEYHLDEFFAAQTDELLPLGDSRLVLAEAPSRGSLEVVKEGVLRIVRQGLTPLFAHPERWAQLAPPEPAGLFEKVWTRFSTQSAKPVTPNDLQVLTEMGCLFQGNLGSFSGVYGRQAASRARAMLARGLYACLGSDGHRPDTLRNCLSAHSTAEPSVKALLASDEGRLQSTLTC